MKRLILGLLLVLGLSTNAFAWGNHGDLPGGYYVPAPYESLMTDYGDHITYLADWRTGSLSPIYSRGSGAWTPGTYYSVSRGASNPSTYVDASGVVQSQNVSNVPRFTKGYYDATGFHAARGLLLEGASTNYLVNSYGLAVTAGKLDYWAPKTNGTINGTPTYSTPDISDITSISGAKSQRIQYTGVAGDGGGVNDRIMAFYTELTPDGSFVQDDVATVSCWARSQNGVVGASTRISIWEINSAGSWQTEESKTITLTTDWNKYEFSRTLTDADTQRIRFVLEATSVSEGDTVDLEAALISAENAAFPSSFIPTTTAALTRNQEVLTFPLENNFPGGRGNALSYDETNDVTTVSDHADLDIADDYSIEFEFNPANLTQTSGCVVGKYEDASNRWILSFRGADNKFRFFGKVGGNTFADDIESASDISTANKWYRVIYSHQKNGSSGFFVDGAVSGTFETAGNYDASNGADLTFGSINSGDWLGGSIKNLRIYAGKALTQADVTARQNGETVSGMTAWYPHTSGTGTTLVDYSGNGHDGTISGATWVKTEHEGSIILGYQPIMLPDEQPSDFRKIIKLMYVDSSNYLLLENHSNANGYVRLTTSSGGTTKNANPSGAVSWTRFGKHTLTGGFSTIEDANSKKLTFYIDGALVASNADYEIPIGSLPATIQLQPDDGQAAIYRFLILADKRFSASEMKDIHTRMLAIGGGL